MSFGIAFCVFTPLAFSEDQEEEHIDEKALQQEFGYYLYDVPRVIKERFYEQTGATWEDDSVYQERLKILDAWNKEQDRARQMDQRRKKQVTEQKAREEEKLQRLKDLRESKKQDVVDKDKRKTEKKKREKERVKEKHEKIFDKLDRLKQKENSRRNSSGSSGSSGSGNPLREGL